MLRDDLLEAEQEVFVSVRFSESSIITVIIDGR